MVRESTSPAQQEQEPEPNSPRIASSRQSWRIEIGAEDADA